MRRCAGQILHAREGKNAFHNRGHSRMGKPTGDDDLRRKKKRVRNPAGLLVKKRSRERPPLGVVQSDSCFITKGKFGGLQIPRRVGLNNEGDPGKDFQRCARDGNFPVSPFREVRSSFLRGPAISERLPSGWIESNKSTSERPRVH